MSETPLLVTDNVSVSYGGIQGLDGVSITIPQSGFVAVLGPNGAGKTTLVRAISGLLDHHDGKVISGSISFDGKDITNQDSAQVVGQGIAHVPEGRMLFAALTVNENLLLGATTRKDGKAAIEAHMEELYELFPSIKDRRSEKAGLLSGGEQQMVAVARALIAQPRLLICDELSLGLAPQLVAQLFGTLGSLHKAGTAILAIEQNARIALAHAEYAYVLESGSVALSGSSAELRASNEIQERYLGGSAGSSSAPDEQSPLHKEV